MPTKGKLQTLNEVRKYMAISDMIVVELSLSESPHMKLFINLSCGVGSNYKSLPRKKVIGELLTLSYDISLNDTSINNLKEAPLFGLAWLGYLVTTNITPLLNILCAGSKLPPELLDVVYSTEELYRGRSTDSTWIRDIFVTEMKNS